MSEKTRQKNAQVDVVEDARLDGLDDQGGHPVGGEADEADLPRLLVLPNLNSCVYIIWLVVLPPTRPRHI